jgi:hypothetical protein
MVVNIPQVNAGDTATALITFEITTSAILPPEDTTQFQIPKRVPRAVQYYLGPSPMIETRHATVRAAAKEAVAEHEGAWEQVEAIGDWVRQNVDYRDGKLKGAVAAIRDKSGGHEDLSSLFVALCRANGVPARTVWIPDHTYAEFYLEDQQGQGTWFPCQLAGTREFGQISGPRLILQKGDNIKVPDQREPQRYVAEFLKGSGQRGVKPRVQFVRQMEEAP